MRCVEQCFVVVCDDARRLGFVFNPFYQSVGPMFGLLMCLSLLFPVAMLIRGVGGGGGGGGGVCTVCVCVGCVRARTHTLCV